MGAQAAKGQTASWLKNNFSRKAFLYCLGAGFVAYACLGAFIWYNAPQVHERQQEKLAAQTIIIDWQTQIISGDDPETGSEAGIEAGITETPPAAAAFEPLLSEPVQGQPLPAAPIEGLFENTPRGRLPVIRTADGLTPFNAYRRPFDIQKAGDRPLIAVAVADLGLSDIATQTAISNLSPDISLILSPYSETIEFWMRQARQNGHEVWLSLPLEPADFPATDWGPHTLLIGASDSENLNKLDWILSRTTGYAGLVGTPEPHFMSAHSDVRPVVNYIFRRGLGFVDSAKTPGPVAQSVALGMNAPYGFVNLWLDSAADEKKIEAALKKLEETARQRGRAVGIIRPLPVSYEQVLKWMEGLEDRGFVLVPLSAVTG